MPRVQLKTLTEQMYYVLLALKKKDMVLKFHNISKN